MALVNTISLSDTSGTFDVGDVERITAQFNAEGVATDPTGTTFTYTTPSGIATTLTYGVDAAIVRTGTGAFRVDLTLTEAGVWYVHWEGTGIAAGAEDRTLFVQQSGSGMGSAPSGLIYSSFVVTVAAANSRGVARLMADYLCDGTNDEVQLQAALDSLSGSYGGTVLLCEGDYYTALKVTITKSYTTLRGAGFGSIIHASGLTGANVINSPSNAISIEGSADFCAVFDLHVNCEGTTQHGIVFNATDHNTVQRCLVKDTADANGAGIKAMGDGAGTPARYTLFSQNFLVNCCSAITLDFETQYSEIASNMVIEGKGSIGGGISCDKLSAATGTQYTNIHNNVVTAYSVGIAIVNTNNVTINNNNVTLLTGASRGIYIAGLNKTTVIGNLITGNTTGTGIDAVNADDCVIAANRLHTLNIGILFDGNALNDLVAVNYFSGVTTPVSGAGATIRYRDNIGLTTLDGKSTAAIIVAASNSRQDAKNLADYVCDGTNDHVEIQAALNAVSATLGGKVYLCAGDYYTTTKITITKPYTVLQGESTGAIIHSNAITGAHVVNSTGAALSIESPAHYSQIVDVQVDGSSSTDYGIAVNAVDFAVVRGCRVVNISVTSIKVLGSASGTPVRYAQIAYNAVTGSLFGIALPFETQHCNVGNNLIDSATTTGISIDKGTAATGTLYADIHDNIVIAVAAGIEILTGADNQVSNNTVLMGAAATKGLRIAGTSKSFVSSNLVQGTSNAGSGISLENADNDNVIANRIDGCNIGINIDGNSDVSFVQSNHVTNCTTPVQNASATTKARNNIGFVTEASGTATVANGTTSIAVTHGLGVTPALKDIRVTPTNNMGSATKFWISTPTSTQFTINVDANPGATTATFVWAAALY